MAIEHMIEAAVTTIKEKLERFCAQAACGDLNPSCAEAVALGIQRALAEAGRETYRAFLESKEQVRDVVCRNGEVYRFKGEVGRCFFTLWGKIRVTRRLYQNASDTKTHAPLDAAWGMENQYLTVEVREAVAYACAHLTPEETTGLLGKVALFAPHATQIKGAVEEIAGRMAGVRKTLEARIREREVAPEGTRILAASLDGVNVLLRNKADGTHEDEDASSQASAYKNAMVGSVSFYGAVPAEKKAPERLISHYAAQMPEERAPTLKARFEAELEAAETQAPQAVKAIICDGAQALWNYVDQSTRFKDYVKILDFWHAAEHLGLAADALFGKGSDDAKQWFKTHRRKLLEEKNGGARALHSMRYHMRQGHVPANRAKLLLDQIGYFQNNLRRMRYAELRTRGLPIGSGPVEAACKTLVKHRLCRSGQRWTHDGGQRILDLRTYVKSGRWDAFWNEYKQLTSTPMAA